MASPSVISTGFTDGSTATATPSVALADGSAVAGETLMVAIRTAAGGAIGGWPVGWTELFDLALDASGDQFAVAWKLAVGGETGNISLTSANVKFAALSWRITGAADPTVTPPQHASVTNGTSTAPDAGTVTPTGGPKDFLYVVIGCWEGEQTSPPETFPTGYSDNQISAQSGTGGAITTNVRIASGSKSTTASSSDDPSAFGISASDDWMATVVAFHPAPATFGYPFVKAERLRIVPLI